MTTSKSKPESLMTPEEKEAETVRRYREAVESAKSGVLKRREPAKPTTKPEPKSESGNDTVID